MIDAAINLLSIRTLNPSIQGLIEKFKFSEEDCAQPISYLLNYYPFSPTFITAIIKGYTEPELVYMPLMAQVTVKELLVYLSLTHAYYLDKKLPEIEQSLRHVMYQHAHTETNLAVLCLFFETYRQQLEDHIRYEEEVFFPYLHRVMNDDTLMCDTKHQVNLFMSQHSPIEEELEGIVRIMQHQVNKQPTIWAYNILLAQIETLAMDLKLHALIEEKVLVPKVRDLIKK